MRHRARGRLREDPRARLDRRSGARHPRRAQPIPAPRAGGRRAEGPRPGDRRRGEDRSSPRSPAGKAQMKGAPRARRRGGRPRSRRSPPSLSLQVEHDALRDLLPHAGHDGERRGRRPRRRAARSQARGQEEGQRDLRPDPGHGDEQVEELALVGAREPEQRDGRRRERPSACGRSLTSPPPGASRASRPARSPRTRRRRPRARRDRPLSRRPCPRGTRSRAQPRHVDGAARLGGPRSDA